MKYLSLLSIIGGVFTVKSYAACWSERLGYRCCTSTYEVVYEDGDGKWGVENNDWCGIQYDDSCWSSKLGYPCCTYTNDIVYQDNDGNWGIENNQWCGIKNNNNPTTTRTTTTIRTTTTQSQAVGTCSNVPNKPSLIDVNSFNDPAKNCNISGSVSGDSLAKAAPFRVGVGLNGSDKSTSTVNSKKMRELIAYQFNSVTYSNLMKAEHMLDKSASQANAKNGNDMPVLKFDTIIDGLEFCKQNNIHMRGHTLVWHVQTPDWFFRTNFQDGGSYVNSSKMEQRMESYIKQMLQFVQCHYPGVVDVWDVVNEAVEIDNGSFDSSTGWNTRTRYNNNPNPWYTTMGPDYVIKAFRIARKYADKNIKLIYNDYNTFMSQKTNAICNLVKLLKAENLIDGVGLQSYLNADWPNRNDYKSAIQKFSSLGVEIQITELTIKTDGSGNKFNNQATHYQQVFKIYKDLKKSGVNITSVTVFGLQDGYLFYSNDSTDTRFWDHNLQKKPVYSAVMSALKS
jgi:GH35 family endo-1,4-beta-xylanase